MAEHCSLSARKHRRHPGSLIAQGCVADRVNTAMNPVQAAGSYTALYPARINLAII
jgi:hypothetical protein